MTLASLAAIVPGRPPFLEWLLIIDDVGLDTAPLETYFPRGNCGAILIKTRNPHDAKHGNVGPGHYHFGGLSLLEAEQLLLKASISRIPWNATDRAIARQIAQTLGCLPLAIAHAATGINDGLTNMQYYLLYYHRMARRLARGLDGDNRVRLQGMFTTWEMCFTGLEERGTEAPMDASEFLNILAFLHFESVPLEIFHRAVRNPAIEAAETDNSDTKSPKRGAWSTVLSSVLSNRTPSVLPTFMRNHRSEDRMRLALRELLKLSLVTYNDDADTVSMHPVVHAWTRERTGRKLADQALWVDIAGRLAAASILLLPSGMSEMDERFHISLLPHIEHGMACRHSIARAMSHAKGTKRTWLPSTPDADSIRMYGKLSLAQVTRLQKMSLSLQHRVVPIVGALSASFRLICAAAFRIASNSSRVGPELVPDVFYHKPVCYIPGYFRLVHYVLVYSRCQHILYRAIK